MPHRRSKTHPNGGRAVVAPSGPRVKVVRSENRLRTYLREGSILNMAQEALSECLFVDVSMHGARVRLPVDIELPKRLIVFDERLNLKIGAELRWQRGKEGGLYIRDGVNAWVMR